MLTKQLHWPSPPGAFSVCTREGFVPAAKWGSLRPILHNFILYSIWGSQNTFTLQAWAFCLMLMEVMRGRFKPPSGCLSNKCTAPICAQVPVPFPSRAPLSGFGKLRSDILNCLIRGNTHTHTHADRACLAHTFQLSFRLTTEGKSSERTWVWEQTPANTNILPGATTSLSTWTMPSLCPCFLAENRFSRAEGYLLEKVPLFVYFKKLQKLKPDD